MSRSRNGPAQTPRGTATPPSRAAASPADRPPPTTPPGAGSRLRPRNWRVPTKLYAILLIPVTVGLVMGGFQVKGSVDTWQQADAAERTARLVRAALTYSQRLVDERDVSAAPLLRGDRTDPRVTRARAATDRAADAFDAAARQMPHTAGLERRLAAFRKAEPGLAKLRAQAYTDRLGGVRTEEGYVAVQHPLMEFANELGLGTGNVTSYGRTVYSMALAKSAVSLQRCIGMHLLVKPGPHASDLGRQRVALSSYAYLEGVALEEYRSGGTEQDAAALSAARKHAAAATRRADADRARAAKAQERPHVPAPDTDTMITAIAALHGTGSADRAALARKGITADSWWRANTDRFDAYRKIEADLADRAVTEAAGIADDAERSTFVTGAAVVVALLAALALAGLMARQTSRSMRGLRSAALDIAQQRLPMIVDQLSRTAPGRVDTRVRPLPITGTDEIGEVARAFDQVHREAVRLAAEQAMLRGNVNAIFANLSRRNETLIEGQLALITDLESRETDPDQLASLFRLDHLATRMRRNGENLLVLSGKEPGRTWGRPVPLVDVVRAASSEVEQYHRIELVGIPEADIHGLAVTDLMHLLAELLENATGFSAPGSTVRVSATRLPDGRVLVEIHDQGAGLTPGDYADINHKLADPPAVDASLSQRMGLFVVGRLADRHGIRVQLRPAAEHTGTTSLVMLPDEITHGGGADAEEEPEFTVSSIIPERQADPEVPVLTAAELGFDDSRYPDTADPAPGLDPVSRSLRRSGRQSGEAPRGPQRGAHDAPHTPCDAPQAVSGAPGVWYPATAPAGPGGAARGAADGRWASGPGSARQSADAEAFGADHPATPQDASNGYEWGSHQGRWAHQGRFRTSSPVPYDGEAESAAGTDVSDVERVGCTRSGPAPSTVHELTDAGLPRRGSPGAGDRSASGGTATGPQQDARRDAGGPRRTTPETPAGTPAAIPQDRGAGPTAEPGRRPDAGAPRTSPAGGTTPSGLPRRTPRAHLVPGAAEWTAPGGSRVSRAPEDVRGRLSSLRRGVRQGHGTTGAGSDSKSRSRRDAHNASAGPDSSIYNQER